MLRDSLRASIAHVGLALREPELFALRYRDGERSYRPAVWVALAATAVLGTTTYGMTMGMLGGANEMASRAAFYTFAAGLAWAIPLPTLYIFNSLSGSRLSASTTLLAMLVTVSWGGLAMIASVPINWFFNVSMPLILPGQFVPYALAPDLDRAQASNAQLRQRIDAMQSKLSEARQACAAAAARSQVAEARKQFSRAASPVATGFEVAGRFERLRARLAATEAEADAWVELTSPSTVGDDLSLDEQDDASKIESLLDNLRRADQAVDA